MKNSDQNKSENKTSITSYLLIKSKNDINTSVISHFKNYPYNFSHSDVNCKQNHQYVVHATCTTDWRNIYKISVKKDEQLQRNRHRLFTGYEGP
jgi:hypothetical protein